MTAAHATGAPRLLSPLRASAMLVATLFVAPVNAQTVVARASDPARPAISPGAEAETSAVSLLVGRSAVLNSVQPITRVSLTSSEIADAMATTPQQLLIHGKKPGTISMFVWERSGAIKRYEVVVERDLSQLVEQMRQLFPGEPVQVASNGKDVVISGVVSSKYVVDKAAEVAAGYVDKKEDVVNLLHQQEGVASNQVMLRVRFAEVSRTALTELGASFFTGSGGYKDYVARTTTQQFAAPAFDQTKGLVFSDFLNILLFNTKYQVGTAIQALQQKGLFQTLAEPNLIAQNGKEASFLAGGEIPVPIAQGTGGNVAITVSWKEFGIRLNFTPTVLGGDLIHLKVRPEVSTLDFNNAVVLQGFRVPALSTRRAETEVELRDGQTFAIAGLLNNQVNSTLRRIPGIGNIPILGLLFTSKAAQKDRTELVVMITPQIVRPGSPGVAPGLPGLIEPFLGAPKHPLAPPPPHAPLSRDEIYRAPATPTASTSDMNAPAVPAAQIQPQPGGSVEPASLTNQEKKVLERARRQMREQQEAAAKGMTREERRAAQQASDVARENAKHEADAARVQARRDAESRKVAEEQARDQARRDAEAKKVSDEAARKQAEIDKKHAKAVADAEAKLKAAEAAYQSEMKKVKPQQDPPKDPR